MNFVFSGKLLVVPQEDTPKHMACFGAHDLPDTIFLMLTRGLIVDSISFFHYSSSVKG